jgi:hypothetical protein
VYEKVFTKSVDFTSFQTYFLQKYNVGFGLKSVDLPAVGRFGFIGEFIMSLSNYSVQQYIFNYLLLCMVGLCILLLQTSIAENIILMALVSQKLKKNNLLIMLPSRSAQSYAQKYSNPFLFLYHYNKYKSCSG